MSDPRRRVVQKDANGLYVVADKTVYRLWPDHMYYNPITTASVPAVTQAKHSLLRAGDRVAWHANRDGTVVLTFSRHAEIWIKGTVLLCRTPDDRDTDAPQHRRPRAISHSERIMLVRAASTLRGLGYPDTAIAVDAVINTGRAATGPPTEQSYVALPR